MSLPVAPQTAERIGDRFEIEAPAGAGGMGAVYRARDLHTGERVALKVLVAPDPVAATRFEREIVALAELRDPAIVRYVADGTTPDGRRYVAMEWLEGEDLAARLARGPLTLAEGVALVAAAARALGSVHRAGVVHRDVKPGNLFLVGGALSAVRLLDFGVARRGGDVTNLTLSGVAVGTPRYMAPEQARGEESVDARADVFALGCVLYECLTGRPAFAGASAVAVLARVLFEDAPRLRAALPAAPAALDALLGRALAKDPAARPADGDALARELDAVAAQLAADPAAAGAAPAVASLPPALTTRERRVLSILVADVCAPPPPAAFTTVRDARVPAPAPGAAAPYAIDPATRAGVLAAAARFSARVEWLRDGTVLVMLTGTGAATDLAARAARCALALRDALPAARVALATGRVEVAHGAERAAPTGGAGPAGAVIDRAVRALAVAPGSAVRIDEETAGLIDRAFDLGGDAEGLFLRGVRDAAAALGAAPRTLLGRPALFVGRERELGSLEAMYNEAVAEPVARAVLVTAPAGTGKSRLLGELLARLAARPAGTAPVVLQARADPVGAGAPFGLLAQAVRGAAGIAPTDAPEVQRRKLRARVGRHVAPREQPRVLEFLGELAGLPPAGDASTAMLLARGNPQHMGDAIRDALLTLLEAECAAGPVVLALEDLHWGDVPTVNAVDGALRALREAPLMVVATARADVHARFPRLWAEREVQELKLAALTRRASERLVREALGGAAGEASSAAASGAAPVDDETVARLVARAEGNAFVLEELVRAEAAARRAGRAGRPYHEGTAPEPLPDSVLGIVQARFDRHGEGTRRVLRAASVFGQDFCAVAVAHLLGGDSAAVEAGLRELVADEVVARGEAANEYRFAHALVRDAAYATLTETDRALGHRLAAEWLERARSVRGVDAAVLAEHYDQGGDAARAVEWYVRAAVDALEGSDLECVTGLAARGLSLGAAGEAAGQLEQLAADARYWRGEYVEAEAQARAALAAFAPGSAGSFRAERVLLVAAGQQARYDVVEAALARVIGTQPADDDAASERALALARVGSLFAGGERQDLLHRVQAALRAPEPAGTRLSPTAREQAELALQAGWPPWAGPAEMQRAQLAAMSRCKAVGDLRGTAHVCNNYGVLLTAVGEYARAEASLREAMAAAERIGATHLAVLARHNYGLLAAYQGRCDEAIAVEEQVLGVYESNGSRRLAGVTRLYLSVAAWLAGDAARAEREARGAVALLDEAGSAMRPAAQAALARALIAAGRAAEALAPARLAAEARAQMVSWQRNRSLYDVAYVEALEATGAHAEAREVARAAVARLRASAQQIADGAMRESYLEREFDNARLMGLARAWGVAG